MENHPIPQDITGFQFKLIGDMTIKQFAYLAIGAVCAWFFFSLPISLFIKGPLAAMLAGLGASLAFVPIAGRPLDTMLFNYLKALYTPNQYIYQKMGGHLAILTVQSTVSIPKTQMTSDEHSDAMRQFIISGSNQKSKNKLDEKELAFIKMLSTLPAGITQPLTTIPVQTPTPAPEPAQKPADAVPTPIAATNSAPLNRPASHAGSSLKNEPRIITMQNDQSAVEITIPKNDGQKDKNAKEVVEKEQTLEKEVETLKQELDEAKKQEAVPVETVTSQMAHQKVTDLQQELQNALTQKAQLEKQLVLLAQKLQGQNQNVFAPSVMTEQPQQPQQTTSHVRAIPKEMRAQAGLPITPEYPNLLVGIVKDARGNTLPNMLVEVKNTDGTPVRAFKTNALGQFATATPLLNGIYTIVFEDPNDKHTFDSVQMEARGEILSPIEVTSSDDRENLRKELFGV